MKTLNVLCTDCRVPKFEPVQDNRVYKVVVPSYLVMGGDGFSVIKNELLKRNSGESLFLTIISEKDLNIDVLGFY